MLFSRFCRKKKEKKGYQKEKRIERYELSKTKYEEIKGYIKKKKGFERAGNKVGNKAIAKTE